MSKPTSIKEAIKNWEEAHPEQKIEDATEIGFQFQWPPIEKMDNSLSALIKCEQLSLSTNMIDRISGISSLKHLKILSLARNNIKALTGLDSVADTLEQLWISYNIIDKTRGIETLSKLKVLYIGNNLIRTWTEFDRFGTLPMLEDFLFIGNPLYESMDFEKYRMEALKKLPNLKKLEGETVVSAEDDDDND